VERGRRPGWNDAGDLLARAMMHVVCRGPCWGRITKFGVGTKLTGNALPVDVATSTNSRLLGHVTASAFELSRWRGERCAYRWFEVTLGMSLAPGLAKPYDWPPWQPWIISRESTG
jgi:hypothetical protein